MHTVRLFALAFAAAAPLTACNTPAAAPIRGSDATTERASDNGQFRLELREVRFDGRIPVRDPAVTTTGVVNRVSVTVNTRLIDLSGGRIYRLNSRSRLESVQDERGRQLLTGGSMPFPNETQGQQDFPALDSRSTSGDSTRNQLSTMFSVDRVPEGISEFRGVLSLDVVTGDEELVIPIPAIETPVELFGGTTITVKAIDRDAETVAIRRMSLESRTRISEVGATAPYVRTAALADEGGNVVATFSSRESATIGEWVRRRYTLEPVPQPPTRDGKPGAVKVGSSLRFLAYTAVETVDIPFNFGPVSLFGKRD